MTELVDRLPKAELHAHIEGTATPALVRCLAERNGMIPPQDLFQDEETYAWGDFLEFLNAYDKASACIRTPLDYRDLTYDYLSRCAGEGAIYVEMFSSSDHATASGMGYGEMMEGIAKGIDDAEREFGIIGRITLTCVRHLGPEQAVKAAQLLVDEPHPYVIGFGMGGDENAHEPGDFLPAYRVAADAGYPCTVHAGEVRGAESVRAAIDDLPVIRIGHGVRAAEDPALVAELAQRGIHLEICPGSNIALGVFDGYDSHPLLDLRDAGVPVSLNSDDPPFFRTSIGREYRTAATEFGQQPQALLGFARMAIGAAFCDDEMKATLLAHVAAAEKDLAAV